MSWEMSLVLKATVLLGAALAAVGCSARMRASRRHLIVVAAFAALIVLPGAVLVMPVITLSLPVAPVVPVGGPVPVWSPASPGDAPLMSTRGEIAGSSIGPSHTSPDVARAAASFLSPATVLRGVWLSGAAIFLVAFAVSLRGIYRLRDAAVPWPAGQARVDGMLKELGLNRTVIVTVHESAVVPATMGVVRPMILLPPDAPEWVESDLRRVLIHELEHVRRGDWWVLLFARAVCALYWFHPLAWIAWRQLGVLAERACDDAVVARMDRADYADQLIALAGRLSSVHRLMLSMASPSDLSTRVRAILSMHQQRGRAGAGAAVAIIGPVALLTLSVASLNAVASQQHRDEARTGSTPAVTQVRVLEDVGAAPTTTPRLPAPEPNLSRTSQTAAVQARTTQATTAAAPAARPAPARPVAQRVAPPLSPPVDASATPYVIGPDDVLTVLFWRDKDSSGEMVVRPDGKISLPLIGEVQAAGLTPEQVRIAVTAQRGLYETNPSVTVQIKEANSRKVSVLGEVAKPGRYAMSHSMTVVELLAAAGGLTAFAQRDAVFISRRVGGTGINIPFDFAAFLRGQQLEQNIVLLPGDTVIVP